MGGKPVSAKRSYSRYFIILQEDEKGYSTDANKFPTGYAKIERKNDLCKVSYYVQNLRKSKEPYYMVLICDRKTDKRLVNLGAINIDDYGRAEVTYEYNVESVANSNIPMENIKGAAIVSINTSDVNGVLSGFVSGVKLDDWKSYAIIENSERSNENKDKAVETESKKHLDNAVKEILPEDRNEDDNLEKNSIFDEYEKNIEDAKNIDANIDRDISNSFNELDEEAEIDIEDTDRHKKKDKDCNKDKHDKKEKHDNKECNKDKHDEKEHENKECNKDKHDKKDHDNKECNKEDKHDKEDHDEKECHKGKHDQNEYDDEDIDDLEEFFEALTNGFEEVNGVCPELGKCKWYKVDCKDLENIKFNTEFNKYTMVYYPMASYYPYIRRSGHYLMGHKCDSKGKVRYIVYAIPGTRNIQDQPFGGATGFVTWVHKNHNDKERDLGYWVMFYDFKNSTVVVPVRK
jgi:ribosomal protein L13